MQRVQVADADSKTELPLVVVDYAHTPDAVTHALTALRAQAMARGGRLWCVVGCGGDRDALKRPLMAAAAEHASDRLVLTSDNPRSESPEAILADMLKGLSRPEQALVVVDRAVAIAQVVAEANVQDVVLLAGKGHETVQEIGGARLPFSDVLQAQRALQVRTPNATGVAA
jgi:UDP-N-acetylmuramoyl-L-alanyl-D-glutamate--2,6-diaminopimelate ligase